MSWAREISIPHLFHVVCTVGCSCHLQEQEKAYFVLQLAAGSSFSFVFGISPLGYFLALTQSVLHWAHWPVILFVFHGPCMAHTPMCGQLFAFFFTLLFYPKHFHFHLCQCMAQTLQCAMCKVQCAMAIFCLSWPWILQHQSHIRLNCTQPFLNYFLNNLRQLQNL